MHCSIFGRLCDGMPLHAIYPSLFAFQGTGASTAAAAYGGSCSKGVATRGLPFLRGPEGSGTSN